MLNIKVRIDGRTPLLMNKFTTEAQQATVKGSGAITGAGDKGTPMEQAAAKTYQNEEGLYIIPQPNIYRSIMDGGSFFKMGKKQVTTQKTSLIPSCVDMVEIYYPLIHKEPRSKGTKSIERKEIKWLPRLQNDQVETEIMPLTWDTGGGIAIRSDPRRGERARSGQPHDLYSDQLRLRCEPVMPPQLGSG